MANRWAVLIGINGYDESLGSLNFCANDAKLMHETLASECCAFPADNIVLLTDDQPKDRQPTFGNIHAWLGTWLSRPGPDDLVLVYFAGHGREANGQALLAPLDATLDSLPVTGIPIQYIRDLLDRCRAAQKVLILDACHSGAGRDVTTMTSGFRKALDAGKGIYTIASCDADQRSYDWPEKEHGVFTHYLVEAVRYAAPVNTEGQVSLDEIYEVTRDGILAWTGGKRLRQEPVRICRLTGSIHLASRPLSIEQKLAAAQAQVQAQSQIINTLRKEVDRLAEKTVGLRTDSTPMSNAKNDLLLRDARIIKEKRGLFRKAMLLQGETISGQTMTLLDLNEAKLHEEGNALQITVSPDGTRVAFTAVPEDRSPDEHLYVINCDGSLCTRVSDRKICLSRGKAMQILSVRWLDADNLTVEAVFDDKKSTYGPVTVRMGRDNLPVLDAAEEGG